MFLCYIAAFAYQVREWIGQEEGRENTTLSAQKHGILLLNITLHFGMKRQIIHLKTNEKENKHFIQPLHTQDSFIEIHSHTV